MDPFTVSTTIAKPREQVFAYLADIANHAEFSDHYQVDWHLLREDPFGAGAGARFRVTEPLSRFPGPTSRSPSSRPRIASSVAAGAGSSIACA